MAATAVQVLVSQLRALRYPGLDYFALGEAAAGFPAPLLPALGYILLRFSKHISALVSELGLQLHGASDLRFVEGVLKFAREALGLRPPLSAAQFLSQGYAERKLELVTCIARACKERHNAAARQERLAALKGLHSEQRLYGTAAAGAQQLQGQQQQKQQVKGSRGGGPAASGIPRPPSRVRVVAAAQQHVATAAGAGVLPELSPEGSDAAASSAVTPTSVLAAAAASTARNGHQSGGAAAEAGKQEKHVAGAATAELAPPPSPAEQPRLLPQPLLPAQLHPGPPVWQAQQRAAAALQHVQHQQPSVLPGPPMPYPSQVTAPPSDKVRQHEQALLMAAVQQPYLQQLPAAGALQHPQQQQPRSQGAVLAFQQQQPQQQLVSAPAYQQQQLESAPAYQQQQQQQQLALHQAGSEQQTRRLIEELHLRLGLAEETAASARQEAQQAREQLQARVTVLEGRVRFLEAGYELRPLPQQPALLLEGGPCGTHMQQQQQGQRAPLALPWGASATLSAAAAPPAAHQHVQQLHQPVWSDQRQALCNPLFDTQLRHPSALSPGAHASSSWSQAPPFHSGLTAPAPEAGGVGRSQWGATGQDAAGTDMLQRAVQQPAAPPLEPAATLQERQFSSTAELIFGMQARFSEAEGFLAGLQRM